MRTSTVTSGIASIMALVAAGAAQADTPQRSYNAELAKQANFLVLDTHSQNEDEAGLAIQVVIACNGAPVKQFAYQLSPEFSALATGYPAEEFKNGTRPAEWLGIDCNTGEAYHGSRDVIDAKVAQMEEKAKRTGKPPVSPDSIYAPIGPGIITINPDGGVILREQNDYPVIEGSPNPGL